LNEEGVLFSRRSFHNFSLLQQGQLARRGLLKKTFIRYDKSDSVLILNLLLNNFPKRGV
jgi:hypothetical protein